MAGNVSRFNVREVMEAVKQFLEDEAGMHQEFLDELAARNRGRWDEYLGRNRSLWSRLLGRLREAGVDAPETVIGSGAMLVVAFAISALLASRRKS